MISAELRYGYEATSESSNERHPAQSLEQVLDSVLNLRYDFLYSMLSASKVDFVQRHLAAIRPSAPVCWISSIRVICNTVPAGLRLFISQLNF